LGRSFYRYVDADKRLAVGGIGYGSLHLLGEGVTGMSDHQETHDQSAGRDGMEGVSIRHDPWLF
jgi:hypothetical protein